MLQYDGISIHLQIHLQFQVVNLLKGTFSICVQEKKADLKI